MSDRGAGRRSRTRRDVRTRHSCPISIGLGRAAWPRLRQTDLLALDKRRSRAHQRLREQRRSGFARWRTNCSTRR
jgi:hypothetical protein